MAKKKPLPPIPSDPAETSRWLEEFFVPKKLPAWLDPSELPAPRWTTGEPAPVTPLLAILMTGTSEHPEAVEELRRRLDPSSVSRLIDLLVERWDERNAPRAQRWMIDALADWGDEISLFKLAERARTWLRQRKHARAASVLDIFSRNGGDAALSELDDFATAPPTPAFGRKAREAFQQAALLAGASTEELSDRVVPTLGLDRVGSRTFDLGARIITARLRPDRTLELRDAAGKTYRSVPRGGKGNDPTRIADAADWVKATRKKLKDVFAKQATRLERSLVARRQWPAGRWCELFLKHPILRIVGQTCLWQAMPTSGAATFFRVAEDLTLADAQDAELPLPAEGIVRLAHPLDLSVEERDQWRAIFVDYGLEPAFTQVDRECFTPTPTEIHETALSRFFGTAVDSRQIRSYYRRVGWTMGTPEDAGLVYLHYRVFEEQGITAVSLHEGVFVGADYSHGESIPLAHVVFLNEILVTGSLQLAERWKPLPLGEVDTIVFSEAVRDVERLARAGQPKEN